MKNKIKTNLKITDCSSITCESYDCDYCPNCSHASYFAQKEDKNNKIWQWFFNLQHGPEFCNPMLNIYKRQPIEKSEAWKVFQNWYDENFEEFESEKK